MSQRHSPGTGWCPCPALTLGDPLRGDPSPDHPLAPPSPDGAQLASVSVDAVGGGGQDAGNSVQDTASPVERTVLSDSHVTFSPALGLASFVAVYYAPVLTTKWRLPCIA